MCLIDGLPFCAGKKRTQEELALGLRTFLAAGVPVVITSDCNPETLPGLAEDLRAIGRSGGLVTMEPYSTASLESMLAALAAADGLEIPAARIRRLIASERTRNVRLLDILLRRSAGV